MKKSRISTLLAVFLCAALLPCTVFAENDTALPADEAESDELYPVVSGAFDDIIWALDSGGTLTFSGKGTIRGYTPGDDSSAPVWSSYSADVRALVIGSGITELSYRAFSGYEQLTSVTLPGSVTVIGDGAFEACPSLAIVSFRGDRTRWDAVSVGENNDALLRSDIRCIGDSADAEPEGTGAPLLIRVILLCCIPLLICVGILVLLRKRKSPSRHGKRQRPAAKKSASSGKGYSAKHLSK